MPTRLRIVLGELATARAVDRMRLPGLSEAAVAALSEPYGVDADELYRKTNGNPFFVVEALAAGADAIPETVRDAVLARAARLGAGARALLDAVAVMPPAPSSGCCARSLLSRKSDLDECLASGMLRSEPRGVAFRHDLARLAVEDEVAPLRRERAAPAGPGRARRSACGVARPRAGRPPCRGRRRCGGGAPSCARRGRACSLARCAPRGGGAVRTRPALRRRAPVGASAPSCWSPDRESAT